MRRFGIGLIAIAALVLGGATVATAGSGDGDDHGAGKHRTASRSASALLRDAAGRRVGRVWLRQPRRSGAVEILARVHGLSPGFHGFHVHTTGRCDAPAFAGAGGHLNPTGAAHGAHAGDLPSLLVNRDGTATLATVTDRFTLADLRDADGSAVMVHSGPDNFANIPSRYGAADQETLNTGDSGSRLACGVVHSRNS